jgi:type VI protein secretion system component VasF
MTLLELTEPLFQYVCRLNRVARKSAASAASGSAAASTGDTAFFSKSAAGQNVSLDYAVVRGDIKAMLEEMQRKAAKDFRLGTQLNKVELPLLFFVDSLISESSLKFASQWNQNRLAYERKELAGDEKFFNLLEDETRDNGDEASERLAVYYICLGLGFNGINFNQPELLRRHMLTIAPRIRRWLDPDEAARICPDSYETLDTRDLTEPPSRKVWVIGLIFLSLTLAAVVSYFWLYRMSANELTGSFKVITDQALSKQ